MSLLDRLPPHSSVCVIAIECPLRFLEEYDFFSIEVPEPFLDTLDETITLEVASHMTFSVSLQPQPRILPQVRPHCLLFLLESSFLGVLWQVGFPRSMHRDDHII